MSSDLLNPSATVTIGLSGLAVCCHNQTFNSNRGRWEIAVPRFSDHELIVEVIGMGRFFIDRRVKFIEIRDRNSVAVDKATHQVEGDFHRTDPTKNPNDFRWVTDFNNDLPHTVKSVISPATVPVTMVYVYDAISYTKSLDSSELIRADLETTGPIVELIRKELDETEPDVNGEVTPPSESVLGPILNAVPASFFEARTMGMDICSSGGDAVDILFDRARTMTIPHGIGAQKILISNVEPLEKVAKHRFVPATGFQYARGDLFRYYELFNVEGPRVDQWGKQATAPGGIPGGNKNCCCNKIRVALPNLDAFLQ